MNKEFRINQLVFDSHFKQVVKLTNGIEKDGKFIPTEGMVFRFLGLNIKNQPILGITYVMVNPEFLSEVNAKYPEFETLINSMPHGEHYHFVGRI